MTGVIIQARMGSSRAPGKVMKTIGGNPILHYSVERTSLSELSKVVIVATTNNPTDQIIVDWCCSNSVPYYRGSEDNVLDRYYKTAREFGLDAIVRVTSDCPFVDAQIVDDVIRALSSSSADYASNHLSKRTWPHGFDVSAFTFQALERAWLEARSNREKEHVTPYIIEHPEIFNRVGISLEEDLSHLRVTVDFPEDIELCRVLIEDYKADRMTWREIVRILEDHPELVSINALRVDSQS